MFSVDGSPQASGEPFSFYAVGRHHPHKSALQPFDAMDCPFPNMCLHPPPMSVYGIHIARCLAYGTWCADVVHVAYDSQEGAFAESQYLSSTLSLFDELM